MRSEFLGILLCIAQIPQTAIAGPFDPIGQEILGLGRFEDWYCNSVRFECDQPPLNELYQFRGDSSRPGTLSSYCFSFLHYIAPKEAMLTIDGDGKIKIWEPSVIGIRFDEVKFEVYQCPN